MRNPFGAPKPPSETTFAPMTRFRNCATPNSQLHPILNLKGRPNAQFQSQKNHTEVHRPQTFTECLCRYFYPPSVADDKTRKTTNPNFPVGA